MRRTFVAPNPKAGRIMQDAKRAFSAAGVSVQGLLPHWKTAMPDPGKFVFWYDALRECGVEAGLAGRTVCDLERAHRGW